MPSKVAYDDPEEMELANREAEALPAKSLRVKYTKPPSWEADVQDAPAPSKQPTEQRA